MTATTTNAAATDAGRLALMLGELRLPTIARAYAQSARPDAPAVVAEYTRTSSKELARDMSQDESRAQEALPYRAKCR